MKGARNLLAGALLFLVGTVSAQSTESNIKVVNQNAAVATMSLVPATSDYITVEGDAVLILITDAGGKVVCSYELDQTVNAHHIDLSNLTAGDYKCILQNNKNEANTSDIKKS